MQSASTGDIQVTVTIPPTAVELTTDFLAQELANGFQELTDTDSAEKRLRFFLKESALESFRLKWERFFHGAFESVAPTFETEFIAEVDWQERFRRETKPVVIAGSILVHPTWTDPFITQEISTVIAIDPKMAFGVGSHETTKLAMCALKESICGGEEVADIGCGSLILSILAAKLGAGHVKAVDTDPLAIENSRENCQLNHVEDKIDIAHGSTERFAGEDGSYDIVVANIISQILLRLLDDMLALVKDNGKLILSGIQTIQRQE